MSLHLLGELRPRLDADAIEEIRMVEAADDSLGERLAESIHAP